MAPEVKWSRQYDNDGQSDYLWSLTGARNGGYSLAGTTGSDSWLLVTDEEGGPVWERAYSPGASSFPRDHVQTTDDGFAVTGTVYREERGNNTMLLRTDDEGGVRWFRTYESLKSDYAEAVIETQDGGFAVAGGTNELGAGWKTRLVKTDENGTLEWERVFDEGPNEESGATDLVQTKDGGYLIVGGVNPYPYSLGMGADVRLVKVDATGDEQWTETHDVSGYDYVGTVRSRAGDGYSLSGWTLNYATGSFDCLLLATDDDGTLDWARTHDYSSPTFGHVRDGKRYVLAGFTFDSAESDPFVLVTDTDGDVEWTFVPATGGVAMTVQVADDGTYTLGGTNADVVTGNNFQLVNVTE